ncbi:hypothetical protein FOZ63_009325, partial [Perkinsus olseni]
QNSHYFKQNTLLSLKRSHDVEAHFGDRPSDDGGAAAGADVRFIQVSASHWPTFEDIFGQRTEPSSSPPSQTDNTNSNEAKEAADSDGSEFSRIEANRWWQWASFRQGSSPAHYRSLESETQQPRESAEAPDTGCLTGWEWITPEVVTKFSCATDEFLCPASANTYGIDFLGFTVRDVDSGVKLLEITKDPPNPGASSSSSVPKPEEDTQQRSIRYHFGPEFLDLRNIGTKLEFSVGEKPIRNFRMIERHYYKDKILKSYDFAMPYCIPNTVNTWEVGLSVGTLHS